LKPFWDGLPLY